ALGMGPAAAQCPDTARIRAQRMLQRRIIELRVVGEGDNGASSVRLEIREGLIGPAVIEMDVRKAEGGAEATARIDDRHLIFGACRHGRQTLSDMHGADNKKPKRRVENIEKNRSFGQIDDGRLIMPEGCSSGVIEI